MRTAILITIFMTGLVGMSQEQLNEYKYVIVPKQFEDFKRENQHQTSTLMKYLLTEKGFNAVYEDDLPKELVNNRCLGLIAKLDDGSSMFTTKASVVLEDCNKQEVFKTSEGKSKEKDYKDSYAEAMRKAFASFDALNYSYSGKAGEATETLTVNMQNDVKNMNEDKKAKNDPDRSPMVEQQATRENQLYRDRRPVESNLGKADTQKSMVEQKATREDQQYRDRSPVESDLEKGNTSLSNSKGEPASSKSQEDAASYMSQGDTTSSSSKRDAASPMSKGDATSAISDIGEKVLYAQELANGYQLVDSTPKIRMKLKKSSLPDFYLADAAGTPGVVFQKDGTWFFEYYSGEELMTKELEIKF